MITNDAAKASESKEIQRLKVIAPFHVFCAVCSVLCALSAAAPRIAMFGCSSCIDWSYRTLLRSSRLGKLWMLMITDGF